MKGKSMSIRRNRLAFEDNYTQIPNAWLRDERLSWKARGILAWLMSHREGWTISERALVENGTDGRAGVRTGLGELKALGYLMVAQDRGEQGRYAEAVYELHDPDEPDPTVVRLSDSGLSDSGLSDSGKSDTYKKTITKEHYSEEDQPKEGGRARGEAVALIPEDEVQRAEPKVRFDKPVRIPDDFGVTGRMRDWAQGKGYTAEYIEWATERFINWAVNATGARASKRRWDSAWENWLTSDRDQWLRTQRSEAMAGAPLPGQRRQTDVERGVEITRKLAAEEAAARAAVFGRPNGAYNEVER